MKKRELFLLGAAAGAVLGGVTWLVSRKLTEPTEVSPLHIGETFATISGTLLSGETLTIPEGVVGAVSLLIMGWDYDAREEVEAWARAIMDVYEGQPGVVILEVPMISGVGPVMRRIIDTAMVRETPEAARSHVLTVYGDLRALRLQLGVADRKHAQVYLLGRTGRLVWHTDGPPAPDLLDSLFEAMDVQGVERRG